MTKLKVVFNKFGELGVTLHERLSDHASNVLTPNIADLRKRSVEQQVSRILVSIVDAAETAFAISNLILPTCSTLLGSQLPEDELYTHSP